MGVGALAHESAFGRLPPGGWGSNWVGDPDAGYDWRQPGGWIFAILPYVEEQAVHDMAKGVQEKDKRERLTQMTRTPLPLFNCPSRRDAALYDQPDFGWRPGNYDIRVAAAKSDYAANAGDYVDFGHGGPLTVEALEGYEWYRHPEDFKRVTGVVTRRAAIALRRITDGLSRTYFAGEKSVDVDSYAHREYQGGGDDQNMYVGFDEDVNRWTTEDGRVLLPIPDRPQSDTPRSFGSAHLAGCGFVFCDGSVRLISYDIDAEVHRRLGNRRDGQDVVFPGE